MGITIKFGLLYRIIKFTRARITYYTYIIFIRYYHYYYRHGRYSIIKNRALHQWHHEKPSKKKKNKIKKPTGNDLVNAILIVAAHHRARTDSAVYPPYNIMYTGRTRSRQLQPFSPLPLAKVASYMRENPDDHCSSEILYYNILPSFYHRKLSVVLIRMGVRLRSHYFMGVKSTL